MKSQQKNLLLFTSKLGYQTRSFEDAAQKMGVKLIYVTDRCERLDDPWEDGAIAAHFQNPEAAAHTAMEASRGQEVNGIIALGDKAVVAAAYAARGLGIPFHHPLAAEACRNKRRTREIFRDASLRGPWFQVFPVEPVPEPAIARITYPCVLKPLSLSASQGVMRANSREEFLQAAARLCRLLKSPEIRAHADGDIGRMLVEGYIQGKEVAVEGLLTEGTLKVLAIFDKPDPLEGPYFEETIYITPSRLPESVQAEVERCMVAAAHALGLSHGPIHAEFRINEEGVWPIEVAPRSIGGLCARALRFRMEHGSEVIGLEELLLRHALELSGSDAKREESVSGVMMIPVPKSGILERIEGEDEARATQGIAELIITARLHDFIAAWPEGSSYLGFIFARGEEPEAVEAAIRAAHQELKIFVVPRLPVEHPASSRFIGEPN
jgi:biotin carboxylase